MKWIDSIKLLVSVVGLLALSSCQILDPEPVEYQADSLAPVNTHLMIPSAVWDKIEEFYGAIEIPQKDLLTDVKVTYVPMTVHLREKTEGVMGGNNFKIPIPDGGGMIDLARYVKKGKRSFYLQAELAEDLPKDAKVYFVSHYMQQRVGTDNLGMKCNQAAEVTEFYRKALSKEGVLLNTTDWRYLNTIGGSLIIFYYKPYDLYMSQVTFHDSRREDYLCEHAEDAKTY